MNLRQAFLATFVVCCLAFEAFALSSLYQTVDWEHNSITPLFSGNLYTWKNQGFTYPVYSWSPGTLNVTASTMENASQRGDKYGESKAIFEVSEDVNKALDNDTVLQIEYQRSNINRDTSSIHFFVWAKNETYQFRINYVIGYIEQNFFEGGIYFVFKNVSMNSSTIYVRPWETVVNLNLVRSPLQISKLGVKLIDYYWEEPYPLSISVKIDLTKSYLHTYYDRAMPLALHNYRIVLIQLSVTICAPFLLTLPLTMLLRKRLSKIGQ